MTRIAWIDVETSGLVRSGEPMPLLLEVALILTDGSLRELGRYSAVIEQKAGALDVLRPEPIVQEMHARSGLWEALREPGTVSVESAEAAMIELLDRHSGGPVLWGGFSPGALDRPVLLHYMPRFYAKIHHRSLDVSSLGLAMLNWAAMDLPKVDSAVAHRAVPDTEESINLARVYRRFLNLATADRVSAEVSKVRVESPGRVAAAG